MTAETKALKVLAGGGMASALRELAAAFEKSTGHAVTLQFGATPELARMIADGAAFDVGVVPVDLMAIKAARAGFGSGAAVPIAKAVFGIGIRAGAERPDVRSPETLRTALLNAGSIAYVQESAAGAHVTHVFERLGIAAALKPKIQAQRTPAEMVSAIASGAAEVGVFLANVLMAPGLELAGPLPGDLQKDFLFVGAQAARPEHEAAQSFLTYLRTPQAASIMASTGLSPASGQTPKG